jgi:membrane protein
MSEAETGGLIDRVQARVSRIVHDVLEIKAVQTLLAVFQTYDAAGGGLVANGLAYSALLALLPGLLLLLSVAALIIDDPSVREQIVATIAEAVPPLEDVARSALDAVTAGAAPTSVIALLGLVWGSSRFYAALDHAFARVYYGSPRRNVIVQTIRGLLLSTLLIATPIAVLVLGSAATWLLDLAPDGVEIQGTLRTALQLASPWISVALFVGGTAAVYRFVPARHIPMEALLLPAVAAGLVLATIAQLFTIVAPRLVGVAALFGAFVAVFAILAWLSISLNILLLGASWTRVRVIAASGSAAPAGEIAATDEAEPGQATGADDAEP